MTEKPLVSVIINCYNGEKYLREAIDSVMAQTYSNWEIVLWDNQSTDSTSDIIESYKDDRIRYFYAPEHTSLGDARNMALEKARGEYISFLDSDDILKNNYLESCVTIFLEKKGEISAVYTNYLAFNTKNERVFSKAVSGIVCFADMLKRYEICISSCLFSNEERKSNNILFNKNYSMIEDYDFYLQLVFHKPFFFLSEPLAKYRMHEDSLTHKQKSGWSRELMSYYQSLCQKGINQQYPKELNWLYVRAINAEINECIEAGEKKKVFKLILKNYHKSPKLLFPLIYIVTGKNTYYSLYKLVRPMDYNV